MADQDPTGPEDFEELLRQLFGANGLDIDPEQIQKLTGMTLDPAMMAQMMRNFNGVFQGSEGEGIDWAPAQTQALHIANQGGLGITSGQQTDLDQAFALANLWLSDTTTIAELSTPPQSLTRGAWVERTMPVWQELAEPVATSITDALLAVLNDQTPDEMRDVIASAGKLMRSIGGSLFATQLGQVIGKLSTEVVAGGDVGIPLLPVGEAAILPQNFADFGSGLEVADDQLALFLSTRELAHARLFRHAKWLRLHVISQVTDYARGIHVDTSALEDLARDFDPSNPEQLRSALESGALLPRQSEEQAAALARLENLLATIEGWVDVVTNDATARLPEASRIGEAVRRRRAVGGPAEKALGALVGLELRPRRLREATAMWRAVTDAVGIAARDALWDYSDLVPTAADIDDPAALIARLQAQARGDAPVRDEIDDALEKLLSGDDASPFIEAEDGTVTSVEQDPRDEPGAADGADGADGDQNGPTPV